MSFTIKGQTKTAAALKVSDCGASGGGLEGGPEVRVLNNNQRKHSNVTHLRQNIRVCQAEKKTIYVRLPSMTHNSLFSQWMAPNKMLCDLYDLYILSFQCSLDDTFLFTFNLNGNLMNHLQKKN